MIRTCAALGSAAYAALGMDPGKGAFIGAMSGYQSGSPASVNFRNSVTMTVPDWTAEAIAKY